MGSDGTTGLARMRRGPVAKKQRKSSLWRRKVTLNRGGEELPGSQLNPTPIFCLFVSPLFSSKRLTCNIHFNCCKFAEVVIFYGVELIKVILRYIVCMFFFLLENESVFSVDKGLVFRVGLLKVKVHKNILFFCYPQQQEAHGLTCETPALKAAGLDVALPVKHHRCAASRSQLPNPIRAGGAKWPIHERKTPRQSSIWRGNLSVVKGIRGCGCLNPKRVIVMMKWMKSEGSAEVSLRQGAGWSASAEPGRWKCALGCFTPSAPLPPASS